jgi:RNase adapter protein RapZ
VSRREAPLFVLTGMSGAGKSTALRTFEDQGYFCIDNLPPMLIETFLNLYRQSEAPNSGVAVVSDVRSGELFDHLRGAVESMHRHQLDPQLIFFDCADEVLVARFAAARRQPPLGGESTPLDAVKRERERMEPLKDIAAHIIDTTELSAAQLRERIRGLFVNGAADELHLTILTFGFKHGVPADADFVFDTRFLPNPFYVEGLRPLTGRDDPVREYVISQPLAQEYLAQIEATLSVALLHYGDVGKNYGVVAIGCTGGQHRSVCLAEELAGRLQQRGITATVQHRDVDR